VSQRVVAARFVRAGLLANVGAPSMPSYILTARVFLEIHYLGVML
jgi:hypothetical protein